MKRKLKQKWVTPKDNPGMILLLTWLPDRNLWQYSDSHQARYTKNTQLLTNDWVIKYYVEVIMP